VRGKGEICRELATVSRGMQSKGSRLSRKRDPAAKRACTLERRRAGELERDITPSSLLPSFPALDESMKLDRRVARFEAPCRHRAARAAHAGFEAHGPDVDGVRGIGNGGNALGTRGTRVDRHLRPRAFEHFPRREPWVRRVKPIENALVLIGVLPSTGLERRKGLPSRRTSMAPRCDGTNRDHRESGSNSIQGHAVKGKSTFSQA